MADDPNQQGGEQGERDRRMRSLSTLFAWASAHGSHGEESGSSFTAMEKERQTFLSDAMKSMTVDVVEEIQRCVNALRLEDTAEGAVDKKVRGPCGRARTRVCVRVVRVCRARAVHVGAGAGGRCVGARWRRAPPSPGWLASLASDGWCPGARPRGRRVPVAAQVNAMDTLLDYIEDLNFASDFQKMGGLELLL